MTKHAALRAGIQITYDFIRLEWFRMVAVVDRAAAEPDGAAMNRKKAIITLEAAAVR